VEGLTLEEMGALEPLEAEKEKEHGAVDLTQKSTDGDCLRVPLPS